MSAHTEQHAGEHHEPHVGSFGSYVAIFGALFVLTAITVAMSRINLGPWNLPVAVFIACIKTSVVVMFFMHVKYATPLIKLTAAAGFVWLLFMFGLTFADYFGREMITAPAAWITEKAVAPGHPTAPAAEPKK